MTRHVLFAPLAGALLTRALRTRALRTRALRTRALRTRALLTRALLTGALLTGALLPGASGCAYELEPGSSAQNLTITDQCRISGFGLLANGDFTVGRVTGTGAGDVRGTWLHLVPPGCARGRAEGAEGDLDGDGDIDEGVDEDGEIDEDGDIDEGVDEDRAVDEDFDGEEEIGEGDERARRRGRRGRRRRCRPTAPQVVLMRPEAALCRLNGVAIGDFTGPARVNGRPGFTYAVNIQDLGAPGTSTNDFYSLSVFDDTGVRVLLRDGEVVRGDMRVDIP